MKRTMLLAGCATALCAPMAHAFDARPDAITLQAGRADGEAALVGAALVWDWNWEALRKHAELTGHTELLLNGWRARQPGGGDREYAQLVLLPTLRMRLARGASPWFLDVGVGVSYLNHVYVTPKRRQSTQWNFYDVLGMGYTLGGPQGKDDIGLRLAHFSNAGIHDPNPGVTSVQLRYTHRF